MKITTERCSYVNSVFVGVGSAGKRRCGHKWHIYTLVLVLNSFITFHFFFLHLADFFFFIVVWLCTTLVTILYRNNDDSKGAKAKYN